MAMTADLRVARAGGQLSIGKFKRIAMAMPLLFVTTLIAITARHEKPASGIVHFII